jgi:hypothetical protein
LLFDIAKPDNPHHKLALWVAGLTGFDPKWGSEPTAEKSATVKKLLENKPENASAYKIGRTVLELAPFCAGDR